MEDHKECLVCRRTEEEIPVTKFFYQKSSFYICAQHMPVLIHEPEKLAGLLPDAEKMKGV